MIIARIIAILLALAFAAAGVSKLMLVPMMVQEFASLGLPQWFLIVTGLIELVAAALLVIPRTARAGAAIVICVMIGAVLAHLTHGQAAMAPVPFVLLILAAVEFRLQGGFSASRITTPAKGSAAP